MSLGAAIEEWPLGRAIKVKVGRPYEIQERCSCSLCWDALYRLLGKGASPEICTFSYSGACVNIDGHSRNGE